MDLRIFVVGLIISLLSIVSLTTAGTAYSCRMCKPGYYASRMCSRTYDTVCKPCPRGTFSSVANTFTSCVPCSKCVVGEFMIEECSHSSDTKCVPCDTVKESSSLHFKTACLQQDEPPRINISNSEGIDLQPATDNTDVYESSSVPEGSGVDISEHVDVNIYPIVNDTEDVVSDEKDELEDGSGELIVIQTTTSILNATTSKPVILTEEEKEITETTTANVTQTSTIRTGIIIPIDVGVVLDNTTTKANPDVIIEDTPDDEHVYIGEPEVDEDNKPKTGASQTKNTNGGAAGASVGVVVTIGLVTAFVFFVLGFLASRVWNGRRERTFNVLEAERRNGKPPVECSGIEYKDSDNKTKPASVYDEIPANSKVNGSGTEPKPNKSNQHMASGPPIYTKPIKKSTAKPTAAPPPKAPRSSASDDGPGNWAGFAISRSSSSGSVILSLRISNSLDPDERPNSQPARPVSEIKYIDEGSDDERETDKLLPSPSPAASSTSNTESTPESAPDAPPPPPSPDEEKVEQDTTNEQTPMIPKDNSSSQS